MYCTMEGTGYFLKCKKVSTQQRLLELPVFILGELGQHLESRFWLVHWNHVTGFVDAEEGLQNKKRTSGRVRWLLITYYCSWDT